MRTTRSKLNIAVLLAVTVGVLLFCDLAPCPAFGTEPRRNAEAKGYVGSQSYRECHERFYQLRSTSFHGLAMQPYSEALAKEKLIPQKADVVIGSYRYRADRQVREWRPRDYQAPLLSRASLIEAAKKRDWNRREEMLQYITSPDRDEVFTASLVRPIPPSSNSKIVRTLLKASGDPSSLVRAAVMESPAMIPSQQSMQAIIGATADEARPVRIRAAAALSAYPGLKTGGERGERIEKADEEE